MELISVKNYKKLMWKPLNIRNLSVIGHFDHGKSTVTQTMLSKAHILDFSPPPVEEPLTEEEQEQIEEIPDESIPPPQGTTTVRAMPYTMVHRLSEENMILIENSNKGEKDENNFLVNVMDTPGHVDFSAEVSAALRLSDGAILVVDCISGCCIQTESVIKLALAERVKPIVFLNKMDKAFLKFKLKKEDLYQILNNVITKINIIIATFKDNSDWDRNLEVDPSLGTVIFGSCRQEWAFSLRDFADIYSSLFNASTAKIMDKLWGDHFFNKATKKWMNKKHESCERGFNMFILDPIFKICDAIMNFKKSETEKLLTTLKIELNPDQKSLEGIELFQAVMSTWLSVTATLFRMIVFHLPSPAVAQKYRSQILYDGPGNDEAYEGMIRCNPKAPVMMYVSKMIPFVRPRYKCKVSRFHGFGRVFSGMIDAKSDDKVRHMVSVYKPNSDNIGLVKKSIKGGAFIVNDLYTEAVNCVPAGNWCAISDLDNIFINTGTLSTLKECHRINEMKFAVSPVIMASVAPIEEEELPQLINGLRSLVQADVLCHRYMDEAGTLSFGVAGVFQMHTCFIELEKRYARISINTLEPLVALRETISMSSSEETFAKSIDGRYRIFMDAEPLDDDLSEDIERNVVSLFEDREKRKTILKDRYGFDSKMIPNIWSFGPDSRGPNMLIDLTKGVKRIKEVEYPLNNAFQMLAKKGPLCEEPMRGTRFHLNNVRIYGQAADESFRGQINYTGRRAMIASFLRSSPRVLEPVNLVEILCSQVELRLIYDVVANHHGIVYEDHKIEGTPLNVIRAHVPVAENYLLMHNLQKETEEEISLQYVFDHWKLMIGDPLTFSSELNKAHKYVSQIRKRKGLRKDMPEAKDYSNILRNFDAQDSDDN